MAGAAGIRADILPGTDMALTIPDKDREAFSKLLRLPAASLEALRAALDTLQPEVRPENLIPGLLGKTPIPDGDLPEVVRILATLSFVRESKSETISEFAESVAEAVAFARLTDRRMEPPSEGWDAFKRAFSHALSADSLCVTAKAAYVTLQHPRYTTDSSILTDSRPIFGVNAADGPVAFAVTHVLQLDVREDDAKPNKRLYVTFTSGQLRHLKAVIDRAFDKEKSLKGVLRKTKKTILDVD